MKLSEVVKGLEGKLLSDGNFETLNFCTATSETDFLTFMENPKYLHQLQGNIKISSVLCENDFVTLLPETVKGVFVTNEPKVAFHEIHNSLCNDHRYCKPEKATIIGKGCSISSQAVIASKNVVIKDHVIIEPFVVINEHVEIGNNCKISSGVVIGGKSFSPVRKNNGDTLEFLDCGRVEIADNVIIYCNTHISRGILPADITQIGQGTIIDALVHIGHNAIVGERVFIAAQALVSGNAVIGDDVWIGVNATVSNRICIGNRARINLGAVVTKNVEPGEIVSGNFAIPHELFINEIKRFNNPATPNSCKNLGEGSLTLASGYLFKIRVA